MKKNIKVFPDEIWAIKSAQVINKAVQSICKKKGTCCILLTGGRSAERIYKEWANLLLSNYTISFYFGDERCVSPEDTESNFGLVMRTLFNKGVPKQYSIHRIYGEAMDHNAEVVRYDSTLPLEIDILILSIGEDGHIASIFPNDVEIHKSNKRVELVFGPKAPNPRITITPKLIIGVKNVFCLASGNTKRCALSKVFDDSCNSRCIPAKLILNCNWLVDKSAIDIKENGLVVKN